MLKTIRSPSDKEREPTLSSMVARLSLSALLIASAAAASTPQVQSILPASVQPTSAPVAAAAPPPRAQSTADDAAIAQAVAQWKALRQTDSLPFSSYAGFLIRNPGFPGEQAMRRTAENRIIPGQTSPSEVNAFFERFPPLTNVGQARHADALLAAGRRDQATEAARKAWTSGSLTTMDEARLNGLFTGAFRPADHDERMDRLLWSNQTTAATRQIAWVSPDKRPLFAARLAMRTRAPDAATLAQAVMDRGMGDAGFIADRAAWLRGTGNSLEARQLLARPRQLTVRPSEVEKWYEVLLENARAAANDSQWTAAYDIASQVGDALPDGAVVRDQTIGIRDDYTSLVWLAGQSALKRRNRPADAVRMFELYAAAAQSPQTQSKGHFWAGRAARAAGQDGSRHLEEAATHADQFYGQLALETLRRPIPAPTRNTGVTPTVEQRRDYAQRPLIQAVRYLGRTGQWQDQTQFVRQIAADAKSDLDHALAAELAASIGRPDLAVMVGRSARANGHSDYVASGFPQVPVPSGHQNWWTMIHAISRQESQFDRAAISSAGARGLMQLMPGTAREVATRAGLGYRPDALTTDIGYNIQLGSTYFQRLYGTYGSMPLAIAAYNAGPGNVNRWVRENGDPRTSAVDMVDWIEAIPFTETRGYVQRVLENAVVYDTLHPQNARRPSQTPLSSYLGKPPQG